MPTKAFSDKFMGDILVSLVIPAYNVENFIEITLNSVFNQTLVSFECIIVNDLSTDGTETVIKKFIKSDKRFKLINHRANAGLSAARNTGLRFAKGKYVAFLDSDDLLMPESLELRSKTLEENTDARVIGTYAGTVDIAMDCKVPPAGRDIKQKLVDFISSAGNCPFNANQPMFITDIFKQFGGFDHALKQAEDYDMWMRLLRCGYKIIPTDKQLVTYRQRDGSMIRENPLLHLDVSYRLFSDCYKKYPEERWNIRFDTTLVKGLSDYLLQLNISSRVLEFIGLGLSCGFEQQLLLDRLVKYLPDYFEIIECHRPFVTHVKKGIDRYHKMNVDLDSKEFTELNERLTDLYFSYKKLFDKQDKTINYQDKFLFSYEDIVAMPSVQSSIDLVFIPHNFKHVNLIGMLKPFMENLGINFIIVDISMHYGDEGVVDACKNYNLPFVGFSNFLLGNFNPASIVVFNYSDPIVRSILISAKGSNVSTVAIVDDVDDCIYDKNNILNACSVVNYMIFLNGNIENCVFDISNNVYGEDAKNFFKICNDGDLINYELISQKIFEISNIKQVTTEFNKSFIDYILMVDRITCCFNKINILAGISSVDDIINIFTDNIFDEDVSLEFCSNLLHQKKYEEARFAFEILRNSDSSNPAYNSGYEIACKLTELYPVSC